MKLLLLKLTLLLLCFTCLLSAQNTLHIDLQKLESEMAQDYLDVEPEILKCASAIRARPLGEEEWELIKKMTLYGMDDNPPRDDNVQKLPHLQAMGKLGKYVKKYYPL